MEARICHERALARHPLLVASLRESLAKRLSARRVDMPPLEDCGWFYRFTVRNFGEVGWVKIGLRFGGETAPGIVAQAGDLTCFPEIASELSGRILDPGAVPHICRMKGGGTHLVLDGFQGREATYFLTVMIGDELPSQPTLHVIEGGQFMWWGNMLPSEKEELARVSYGEFFDWQDIACRRLTPDEICDALAGQPGFERNIAPTSDIHSPEVVP